jgi:hypothetical protein
MKPGEGKPGHPRSLILKWKILEGRSGHLLIIAGEAEMADYV